MIPIWQNTTYTYNSNGLTYYVEDSYGNRLFTGKAIPFPGNSSGQININKICENYLHQNLTILNSSSNSGTETHSDAAKTFYLKNLSNNSTLGSYTFYYDWSYEPIGSILSKPINGRYTEGMFKLQTQTTSSSVITSYNKTAAPAQGYATLTCGEWVLYYLNRFGGWDAFLIEGLVRETDDFTVDSFDTVFDRSVYYSRENNRFRNEIVHNWELNTGWLTDRQSEILAKHLLSSNQVFLHNLVENKIYAVDIKDTNAQYKKFKTEHKLISYTINVKDSNKKVIL